MSKKEDSISTPIPTPVSKPKVDEQQPENNSTNASRRTAVRTILAGGGSITAAVTASSWSKPIINAVITPAHAQTSAAPVNVVLAGNIGSTPVVKNSLPKNNNSVLDFFIGSANAQETTPDLSGACLTITVSGTDITMSFDFFSSPSLAVTGILSSDSFSGTANGITVSGSLNLTDAVSMATGTVSNDSGTFAFTADSATSNCSPIEPAVTPEPAILLSGPTSADSVATQNTPSFVIAALVGEQNAGRNQGNSGDSLNQETGDSTHCVSVTIRSDRQSVDVSVNGPDIPFGFERVSASTDFDSVNGYYYTNYQASGSLNFSGSSSNPVPLNASREFEVVINGLNISGTVDESLMSASGSAIIVGGAPSDVTIATEFYSSGTSIIVPQANPNQGAFWSAQADAGCSPGMGLRQTTRIRQA